ncbi:MAG: 2Fe-2S iron-sulfur cluster-binding protein [Planctomycetota bacterium]|nr:2Fe-2S iron-sulfur cluster-binding protein [Planctomycetota bacterium]
MPTLTIDNREVEVPAGATILHAARKLGIRIPTLCYWEGLPPRTSCLVCVVRVQGLRRLVPACAYPVRDKMIVESDTPEVHTARRTALELLMGEHLGDCVGPCVSVCPAHMDIPRMMGQLKLGHDREALITATDALVLPGVLGYICPNPCESGCRRAQVDAAVAIRLMHRYAAAASLTSAEPYLPPCAPPTGRKVAIVGAGPAGLAAAWVLRQQGHAVVILDDREQPGGQVRYAVDPGKLPRAVLDAETAVIAKLGAQFRMKQKLGAAFSLEELRRGHDAVLLALGEVPKEAASTLGLELAGRGLKVHGHVIPGRIEGFFAAGSAIAPSRFAVRAVASGRAAAAAIGQFLAGVPIGAAREFVIHAGKLEPQELKLLMAGISPGPRMEPGADNAVTSDQAKAESARCMQCGCLKEKDCRLRQCAAEYGVQAARYKGERRRWERESSHPQILMEHGKCISCGLCIQVAKDAGESLGMAYFRRGFNVRVAPPFDASVVEALKKSAVACAAACPTAAIALREKPGPAAPKSQ